MDSGVVQRVLSVHHMAIGLEFRSVMSRALSTRNDDPSYSYQDLAVQVIAIGFVLAERVLEVSSVLEEY